MQQQPIRVSSGSGLLQVGQQLQVGQYKIFGLKQGQQLLKMSDGTFKVTSALSSPSLHSTPPPCPLVTVPALNGMDFSFGAAVEIDSTSGGHVEHVELETPLQPSDVNNQRSMRSTETVKATINSSPVHILIPEKSAAVTTSKSTQPKGKSFF